MLEIVYAQVFALGSSSSSTAAGSLIYSATLDLAGFRVKLQVQRSSGHHKPQSAAIGGLVWQVSRSAFVKTMYKVVRTHADSGWCFKECTWHRLDSYAVVSCIAGKQSHRACTHVVTGASCHAIRLIVL